MRNLRIVRVSIAVLLVMLGAVAWSGCGEEASSTGNAAILSGLDPFVAGAMLTETKNGTETTVDNVTQDRNWTYVFQVEASDPRVSGTLEVIMNADAPRSGGAKYWGTLVLTNSKGTWVCDNWDGAMTAMPTHQFTFSACKGTGAYQGLALYIQWHMVDNSTKMLPPSALGGTAVSGWIQKVQ
jgi:hypothetical protein